MTAEPTTTYTAEEAYALFRAGAIVEIGKTSTEGLCKRAFVLVGDVPVPIERPEDIHEWLKMDEAASDAVRLKGQRHFQHANHAPKKAEQVRLL